MKLTTKCNRNHVDVLLVLLYTHGQLHVLNVMCTTTMYYFRPSPNCRWLSLSLCTQNAFSLRLSVDYLSIAAIHHVVHSAPVFTVTLHWDPPQPHLHSHDYLWTCVFLCVQFPLWLGLLIAFTWCISVCVSRIYLGVHTPLVRTVYIYILSDNI